jgi:hypothetical protein
MARPGGDLAAGAEGRGHLRASRADREQVIITLKAAFVQGMLAKDEFDLRVAQTFASRTYAELAAVIADIPPGLPTTCVTRPMQAQGGQPVVRPGPVLGAATAAYAAAWAFALTMASGSSSAPPVIVLGGVVYLGVLLICVAAMVALRREKRSGRQPPRRDPGSGGQTSPRFPPTDQDKRLPPGQHGHTYSVQAARERASRPALPVRGRCVEGAFATVTAAASC